MSMISDVCLRGKCTIRFGESVVLVVKVMARCKYPEDTELREGPKCKMDNFRDLRIGSPALVVPPQSQLK